MLIDWNFGVFFLIPFFFWKIINFSQKSFCCVFCSFFGCLCWVSGEFSVWFYLAPLTSHLYPVFPSLLILLFFFYKLVWNHVAPVMQCTWTHVWMDENLSSAGGSTFLQRSRVLATCVCLHASDATQADVRMSVSFPFPACLRHMGSRC